MCWQQRIHTHPHLSRLTPATGKSQGRPDKSLPAPPQAEILSGNHNNPSTTTTYRSSAPSAAPSRTSDPGKTAPRTELQPAQSSSNSSDTLRLHLPDLCIVGMSPVSLDGSTARTTSPCCARFSCASAGRYGWSQKPLLAPETDSKDCLFRPQATVLRNHRSLQPETRRSFPRFFSTRTPLAGFQKQTQAQDGRRRRF